MVGGCDGLGCALCISGLPCTPGARCFHPCLMSPSPVLHACSACEKCNNCIVFSLTSKLWKPLPFLRETTCVQGRLPAQPNELISDWSAVELCTWTLSHHHLSSSTVHLSCHMVLSQDLALRLLSLCTSTPWCPLWHGCGHAVCHPCARGAQALGRQRCDAELFSQAGENSLGECSVCIRTSWRVWW